VVVDVGKLDMYGEDSAEPDSSAGFVAKSLAIPEERGVSTASMSQKLAET
jgi:hypothetical protein